MSSDNLAGRTVLVADDEPLITELLSAMLSIKGWEALTAATADDALSAAIRHNDRISLILLDYSLAGNRDLLFTFLNTHTEIKVILISGYPEYMAKSRRNCYRYEGFLQKPFSSQTVFSTIEAVLNMPSGLNR